MRIDLITVVPELLVSPLGESILRRAQDKGLVEITHWISIKRRTIILSAARLAWCSNPSRCSVR